MFKLNMIHALSKEKKGHVDYSFSWMGLRAELSPFIGLSRKSLLSLLLLDHSKDFLEIKYEHLCIKVSVFNFSPFLTVIPLLILPSATHQIFKLYEYVDLRK